MAIGTIGKYERLDVLGHGTSGVVYLAWDTLLRRQVALKEIRAAEPEWERVLEEARVLDRLGRHPHIVHVNGVDHEAGAILIDMELVKGRNLAEVLRLRNGEPLLPREAVRIARAVLSALQYAHEKRIIHRDVKPANILIGDDNQTIKLTDFGLAEALGTGSVAGGGGTYPYMAPEDFADDASSDYRSDLWAVGVVLYEMLTARRPFAVASRPGSARSANSDPFAWKRVIEETASPPVFGMRPGISRELSEVVQRALAKNKSARYPTAQIFSDALHSALRTLPDVPLSEQVNFSPPAFSVPDATVAQAASPVSPQWEAGQPFILGGGATVATTLDELLAGAAKHWDEGKAALLDGRMENFLRSIGEIYIADLARELAARPGESADKRFREFLTRSRGDETGTTGETADFNADAATPPEDATLPFRSGRRLLRRRAAPPTPPHHPLRGYPPPRSGEGSSVPSTLSPLPTNVPSETPPVVTELPSPLRGGGYPRSGWWGGVAPRWWFWPLFLLCLGPLGGAFLLTQPVSAQRHAFSVSELMSILLAAWAASGFCAALLLLVGLGARFPLIARMVCALPVMGGLVAVGALVAGQIGSHPSPDTLVRVGVALMVPLIVLLLVAGTTARLWKLWAWVTVLCAVVGSLAFFLR